MVDVEGVPEHQELFVDVNRKRFETTKEFWKLFVDEPDQAVQNVFPKLKAAFEAEVVWRGVVEPMPLDDLCQELVEVTQTLTDPNCGRLGVSGLGFDPLEIFRPDDVKTIVRYGTLLLEQS